MDQTSKIVQMSNGQKMVIPKAAQYFSIEEKHHIIQEFLNTTISKNELWIKYTGKSDHGRLLSWMRKLGYQANKKETKPNFVHKPYDMNKEKGTHSQQANLDQDLRYKEQEAKITELQEKLKTIQEDLSSKSKELELAQIKAIAYSTMIDLAEKEFNIPIRKK